MNVIEQMEDFSAVWFSAKTIKLANALQIPVFQSVVGIIWDFIEKEF